MPFFLAVAHLLWPIIGQTTALYKERCDKNKKSRVNKAKKKKRRNESQFIFAAVHTADANWKSIT